MRKTIEFIAAGLTVLGVAYALNYCAPKGIESPRQQVYTQPIQKTYSKPSTREYSEQHIKKPNSNFFSQNEDYTWFLEGAAETVSRAVGNFPANHLTQPASSQPATK